MEKPVSYDLGVVVWVFPGDHDSHVGEPVSRCLCSKAPFLSSSYSSCVKTVPHIAATHDYLHTGNDWSCQFLNWPYSYNSV